MGQAAGEHGPRACDRASTTPLWTQVLIDLERRIAIGAFAERFPTDRELTDQYSVSRQTARAAVAKLQSRGLLVRRSRAGSALVTRSCPSSFAQLMRTLRALGVQLDVVVQMQRPAQVDNDVARALEANDDVVHVIELLVRADGLPLALQRRWHRHQPDHPITAADALEALQNGGDPTPNADWLEPTVAGALEAVVLEVPEATPLLALHERGSSDDDSWWWMSLVRPDRYRCTPRWQMAPPPHP